jgi:hypothetical protein
VTTIISGEEVTVEEVTFASVDIDVDTNREEGTLTSSG